MLSSNAHVGATYLKVCDFIIRVEASITDHLRHSPLDLEKYKVVQFLPFRKIEIGRTAIFF